MGEGSVLTRGFRLGPWLVKPAENRITDGTHTLQLEPKMIDVLVLLAERAGEVVAKAEIEDRVWSDVFVTESVITRAIAGLRRALGDDATAPRFIETIPRRGYRLLAAVGPLAAPGHGVLGESGPAATRPAVGRWVRGRGFVGRERLLAEILDGPRHALWVMGSRTVGKTSLLRQLELVTDDPLRPELPLYWDLQGAATAGDLADGLAEALLDAGDRFERAGVVLDGLATGDVSFRLSSLRRVVGRVGRRLLLLVDEAEALIAVGAADPAVLGRLRRVLQAHEDQRSVLAATSRLWALAEPFGDTSPFLHGFAPPLPLGMLADDEAAALLSGLLHGGLDADAVEAVRAATGNHPALLQLVAARLQESGALEGALATVAVDPSVSRLFGLDWELRTPAEREVLGALAASAPPPDTPATAGALHALEAEGVLRPGSEGPTLAGTLLAAWIRARD